jgi:hypothetical protein
LALITNFIEEKKMINILLAIWQFPQNILGWIMSRLWKKRLKIISSIIKETETCEEKYNVKIYVAEYKSHISDKVLKGISGFSLGRYICINDWDSVETVLHETGHAIQSMILGPLYLPIIGVWSAVFCNLWDRWFHKTWTYEKRTKWYYTRFPEWWADKLGKVKRF